MQKRQRYCREMPLLTSTYHSTRKWGRALYTHHTTEIANGELTVEPAQDTQTISNGDGTMGLEWQDNRLCRGACTVEPACIYKHD